MNNRSLGTEGEQISSRFLINKGYEIIECNYRNRYGEIDIVAKDKNVLVFVEVKLRSNSNYGRGLEAITAHKVDKIHQVALDYIQKNYECEPECRFDVIDIKNSRRIEILHIENAF